MKKIQKLSPQRVAHMKAKTASLARPMPATRNADGSIKPRDKTGGAAARKAAAEKAAKDGNKQEKTAETAVAVPATADIQTAPVATTAPAGAAAAQEGEALAPGQSIQVPTAYIAAALECAGKKDVRFYLNGVFIHQVEDELRIAGTDGHRLFVATISKVDAETREIGWAVPGVILPRDAIESIVRYVGRAEAISIEYGVGHPAVTIREMGGMGQFSVQPIAGNYPQYQRVIDAAAAVFSEREEAACTVLNSKYLKAAGATATALGAKGVMPFLAPADSSCASVFAFTGVPNCLLYISPMRGEGAVLPAPTVRLFGKEAMRGALEKIEAAIEVSARNATTTKHEHFKLASLAKVERLTLRAEELRAALTTKVAAPAPVETPTQPASNAVALRPGNLH